MTDESKLTFKDDRLIADAVADVIGGWMRYLHAYEGAKAYVTTHPNLSDEERSRLDYYDWLIASVATYG